MSINFELYKVFYEVAKSLSFSKASKHLYISQSAVSQNIKQLEDQLETNLFNRSTKQVTLTREGEQLLAHIEPAIQMIQSGETYLQETKTLDRGELHIGASDTICRYYLLNYIKDYHDQYPNIEIKITNRTSIQCVDLLNKGLVDMIVTNLPNDHISDDMITTITHEFMDVFVAHPDRSFEMETVRLEDLVHQPILMLGKATATSEFLYKLFEDRGLRITPAVELGSIDLLMDLTKIDLGISMVPGFCLPDDETSLKVIPLEEPLPLRHIGVTTHRRKPLSTAATAFIKLLS